ncbi:MAG: hypothetical protein ACE5OZ_18885 [Candidatus Heimdallarchaeota archaeon]
MKNTNNRLLNLSLVCGIIFFGSLQVAMVWYQDADGDFDISRDFISNLGNEDNTRGLFFVSMFMGFISILTFWLISPSMFSALTANLTTNTKANDIAETVIRYNAYLGGGSSLFMPFIAIFSDEKSPGLHKTVTLIFLISMTVAMACYSLMLCWLHWINAANTTGTPIDDIAFIVVGIVVIGVGSWLFPVTELLTPGFSLVIFAAYLGAIGLLRYFWQKYLKSLAVSFSFLLSVGLSIFLLYAIPATLTDIFVLSNKLRSVVEIGYVYLMILWMTGLLMLMKTQLIPQSSD